MISFMQASDIITEAVKKAHEMFTLRLNFSVHENDGKVSGATITTHFNELKPDVSIKVSVEEIADSNFDAIMIVRLVETLDQELNVKD